MPKGNKRDEFPKGVRDIVAKRASYICSNPECRSLTLCPSDADIEQFIYIGKVAHITAAAPKGPRYDPSIETEQRSSGENALFLCSNCADMVDKNKGMDYPANLLREWKTDHETWVKEHLNKSPDSPLTVIDGQYYAKGEGRVTGIDAQEPVFIKPGTKSVAEGVGEITAARIAYKGREKK